LQAYALACAAPKGALRSTLELALPAGLGYTACTSKEVGLKSPEKSGSRARQTLRFFCARTLLNGRGCDGYKTLRGKKSAKLFLGFEPPAASDGCAQNALFEVVYQRLEKERFMAQSVPALAPILAVADGVPTTTSADVARHFGKPHHRVLDAIRNLLPQLPDGGVPNFRETPYTDPQNGQTYPAYRLTRDGFTLLAMGFTGKKALAFKLAYIDAFNKMEQALHTSDPERVKLAQSLAAEVAAVASRTVFEAVLAGDADWRINRWLFSLNYDRKDGGLTRPLAQAIGHDQMVVSMKELPGRILEPGGMWASSEELASLAAACTQKLAQRFQTKSASGPLQEKAISYQHGSEKETA
jgi:Rha family phage regulatory protein